jgi:hypothetical protein
VDYAFKIIDQLESGDLPTDQDWEALFESEGYAIRLCKTPDLRFLIKEAYELVFLKKNKSQKDSLIALPLTVDKDLYFKLVISNLERLRQNQAGVQSFMDEIELEALQVKAFKKVHQYLPARVTGEMPRLYDIAFAVFEPDALVTDCGMVIDIMNASKMGEAGLIDLLAHEIHHLYRNQYHSGFTHPLLAQLNNLQSEGIADLVDKKLPPIQELYGFPQSIIDFYNWEYTHTPEKLQKLDSLTNAHLDKKLGFKEYDEILAGFFAQGGHPNGFYMANLIVEKLGQERLLEKFEDPQSFLLMYQEAAKKSTSEYIFSETFLDYVDLKMKINRGEVKSDRITHTVTFEVMVPSEDDEVYIAGDHEALGGWDPSAIKLIHGKGKIRTISMDLPSPITFKFTRGSWQSEGFISGMPKGKNLMYEFARPTTLRYEIESWADEK